MIFDTSVVLQILRDKEFFKNIKDKIDEDVKITSVSVYELLRGAIYIKLTRNSEKELNILLDLFSDISIMPFTSEDAKIASIIWAKLKAKGLSVNDADIMISAICIRNGERLLTLDSDFGSIKRVYKNFGVEIIK
ncbi:type II toxin-antitoxin system VapC family toxin [Archaeoglobus sp.]